MKYSGFVVLLDGKVLSWGVGEFPSQFPNVHVDPDFFSGSTYDRMLSFCMGESLDSQPKPKRSKIAVRRYKVRDVGEFRERIRSYNLHPDFAGYDLISGRFVLKSRRKRKKNEESSTNP